jgi:hypothetical protein
MIISFNDHIGFETINKEYKEFTFNCAGINIDNKLAEKYCYNNKFDFNEDVLENLKKYLKVYLPKYACSFWNSKISKAKFYIGVNDFGLVKGIPFCGEISTIKLTQYINKIIKNNIVCLNDTNFSFNKYVKINLIKVKGPDKPKHKINPKFSKFLIEKEKYMKYYNDYIKGLNEWRDKVISLSQTKLVDLVNTNSTRQEIIKFIFHHDPNNKFIDLLKTDFKLEKKPHEYVMNVKNDINSIYYWVTRWKDTTREKMRCQKPILEYNFKKHNTPMNIITSISDMTPYWYHNNKNMNLYLIIIKFKHIDNNYIFSHYDKNSKWLLSKRVIYNGSPACIAL